MLFLPFPLRIEVHANLGDRGYGQPSFGAIDALHKGDAFKWVIEE